MSPTIDPTKLKVPELRSELQARGLDTKGTKPVLVKRLKKALDEEQNTEVPDTAIADTSAEELDSLGAEEKKEEVADVPEEKECDEPKMSLEQKSKVEQDVNKDEPVENQKLDSKETDKTNGSSLQESITVPKPEENVEKSCETSESADVEMKQESIEAEETEQKGEKRKRSEGSPERVQKKREKSPVKEDEPEIDSDKVLLSWYDSDLHLMVDKQTFLSAKPIHEGLFGYAWAGVRATHGLNSGKVRYEVKITEELKWEDFTNQRKERQEKARERREKEKQKQQSKFKKTNIKPSGEQVKAEDKKDEKTEDKKDEKTEKSVENIEKVEESKEGEGEKMEVAEEAPEEVTESTEDSKIDSSEKEEDSEKKIESEQKEEENKEQSKPEEPILTHIFRVGWSVAKSSLQLGEDELSYGYESTGKFVSNKEFVDFAALYKLGDVIGAYLNITSKAVEIQFTVNGELQPEMRSVPRSELPEDFVLFPHVLSRNLAFELNLGSKEEPWFPNPENLDHPFVQDVQERVQGPTRPEKREECEVIMMFGLPGSGKTHWVKEYLKSNEDKQMTIIGCSHLLDRMTVRGQPLKSTYNGRWSILLDKLQRCLNRLSDIAPQRRRNYILDQTNVFPSAQRRKMRAFEGFKRRAVIVVVADEEQAKRQSLKEAQDGKDVPDYAILEMKANMVLPTKGEFLEEIEFADLKEEEAKVVITKYNAEGKAAGYQPGQRKPGFKDDRNRWNYKRNDFNRGNNFRDNRGFQRFDRGPRGWGQPPPPGRFPGRRPLPPPIAGGRDWMRNNRGPPRPPMGGDRNGRDARPPSNYNRNRPGNWQAGGSNFNQGNWGQQQGNWGAGSQNWGGYQQQGGWNANQWKYGGGGGGGNNQQGGGYGQQQGYGQNWNNYYAQNWTGQSSY